MVRVLVAFLIEVGKGKREPEEIPKLLEAKDRKQIPFTAPPEGLYLERIYLTLDELIATYEV
jgi:tRNA pseudouridine38-40 synthase